MSSKKITIVGSGSAGLMTALILKKTFSNYDITIVSSSTIGIIGVGEGTTEHLRWFMEYCEIPLSDFITASDATLKTGVRYLDWSVENPDFFKIISGRFDTKNTFLSNYVYAINNNIPLGNLHGDARTASNNLIWDFDKQTILQVNQFHFDTFKVNTYLKGICTDRKIKFLDEKIVDVEKDTLGFIDNLICLSGARIGGDLFIDSSGFGRVLSKHMDNQEFVSYSEYLPTDTAIGLLLPHETYGGIRPYTTIRALNAGWSWAAPTQSRYGNGYVFSSKYITATEAADELSQVLNTPVEPAITIKFNSGYWKQSWQKNCIAIGLSSSFVEPLEATSITTTIQQARLLCSYLPSYQKGATVQINEYHRIIDMVFENILTMISLHFMATGKDTPMWQNQQRAPKPPLLQRLLELWNERPPERHDIPSTDFELFRHTHFFHMAAGLGLINKTNLSQYLEDYGVNEDMAKLATTHTINSMQNKTLSHEEFLNDLAASGNLVTQSYEEKLYV